MDKSSIKVEELGLKPENQTVPNNEWILLRGSESEIMFEVLQIFAVNILRWKRTSSHRFSEEKIKKNGFKNRTLRCNVQ
eukprot:snap_masked-scaffold_91-processed-gene-0.14-mRNA-1 protein AED:1.00 eAED:1.00 QI:0/-1/0/0/-1/1/1/0/78